MSAIFLHSDKAAGRAGVGLNDVHRARDEQVAEAEARELAFAAGDRDRQRGLDLAIAGDVLGRHRLLEPADVVAPRSCRPSRIAAIAS